MQFGRLCRRHCSGYIPRSGRLCQERTTYAATRFRVTLRRVQRGIYLSGILPALLKARELTQDEFATKVGMSRVDVNGICKGRVRVGDARLRRVARGLEMEPDDLRAAASDEDEQPPGDVAALLKELRAAAPEGPMASAVEILALLERRLALAERQLGIQAA